MRVIHQVLQAYADCWMERENGQKIRNLDFRADTKVVRDDAADIMELAVPGGYNEFRPFTIRQLPQGCAVEIAREGSPCLYVYGASLAACKRLGADECDAVNGAIRVWWD